MAPAAPAPSHSLVYRTVPPLSRMATPSPGRFTIRFEVNSAATIALGLLPLSAICSERSDRRRRVLCLRLGHAQDELRGDTRAVVRVGERARVRLLRATQQQEPADAGDQERGEDDPAGEKATGEARSQAEAAEEEAAARPTRAHGSSLLGEARRRMGERSQSGNGPVTKDRGRLRIGRSGTLRDPYA